MEKNKKFTNLFKKLKKVKLIYKIIFIFTFLFYLASLTVLTYGFTLLTGIETFIRIGFIILAIIYLLVFLISSLASLISQKNIKQMIFNIITLLIAALNIFGYYYINKTYKIVDNTSKEKIIYTTNLLSLSKENEITKVGILNNKDNVEYYTLPEEYIATNNKKYQISYYDEEIELLDALYQKEVDAIFVPSNYDFVLNDYEGYENIKEETVIIDTYSKELKNQDTVSSTHKSLTEPITVLLLGVDSRYDGLQNNAAFNGDSIMLVTFNPKTLSATMFSIPRDTYVPIACTNKSYKINSAAGHGTKCMIDTIQNLTGIDIDYYVKINFKGVVALVEALDGITLDIEEPDFKKNGKHDCKGIICEQDSDRDWDKYTIYIKPGENVTLNGEQALAYARNRHQWALSDFKRIEHQQAVVTAIANKAKSIRSLDKFYEVFNAVSNNIDTNMSPKEILSFYNVAKDILLNGNIKESEFLSIQKTYLTGYGLSVYNGRAAAYTYQYYEESLNEIINAMKENLGLIKPTPIKTFNFSVNDEYKVPTIGKTYSAIKRNESLPNFVGENINYVEDWLEQRNISLTKTYTDSSECQNDEVLSQNVHAKTLVSGISSLTVEICKYKEPIEEKNKINEEEPKQNEKEEQKIINKEENNEQIKNDEENQNEEKQDEKENNQN